MGARFSPPIQTGPGAHSASCTMDNGSFPVVKSGRGVTLTPHPLLVLWSRKSRAIPLLPLWAVRPVQSLSASTTVHFTFTYTSTPPMGLAACTEPQCLYKGAFYLYLLSRSYLVFDKEDLRETTNTWISVADSGTEIWRRHSDRTVVCCYCYRILIVSLLMEQLKGYQYVGGNWLQPAWNRRYGRSSF